MEVHHPHHISHKKKWKEYFLDFFMLFLAVTLGFFAENQREHLVERHKESQYIQSLYEDLKKDTSILNAIERYNKLQIDKIDSTTKIINDAIWNDSTLKLIYAWNLKTLGNIRLSLNERTSSQLKNSGSMRLIENQIISNKISEYWELSEIAKNDGSTIEELKLKAREKSYSIFDQTCYEDISLGKVGKHPKLMNYDSFTLKEYNNRIVHIRNSIKNVHHPRILKLKNKAIELLVDLKKEYKLNDNVDVESIFKH